MRRPRRASLLALAVVPALACSRPVPVGDASASSVPEASASPSGAPPTARQENLITEDEIRTTSATTVFMLIQRARPQYLQPMPGLPSGLSGQLPLVYVDGRRRGPIGTLRTMQPGDIVSIRRISPSQGRARYGPDAATGIIEVSTRPAG